jgi:hypothetical protein
MERSTPEALVLAGRGYLMIIYQEKIAPPLAPLNRDEQKKLQIDKAASEDRWVEDFINRLAGVVRDIRH